MDTKEIQVRSTTLVAMQYMQYSTAGWLTKRAALQHHSPVLAAKLQAGGGVLGRKPDAHAAVRLDRGLRVLDELSELLRGQLEQAPDLRGVGGRAGMRIGGEVGQQGRGGRRGGRGSWRG